MRKRGKEVREVRGRCGQGVGRWDRVGLGRASVPPKGLRVPVGGEQALPGADRLQQGG